MSEFELIVVDDGSTDSSGEILSHLTDRRVKVIRSEKIGLPGALNLGLTVAQAKYVARMDSDDIARPQRLKKQLDYMESRAECGIVSTDSLLIDENGKTVGRHRGRSLTSDQLRDSLLFRRREKPIIHPSVLMRRDLVTSLGGYRDFRSAEDQDLWLRAVDVTEVHYMTECLLEYRLHAGSVSAKKATEQATSACLCGINYLVRMGIGKDLYTDDAARLARIREKVYSEISQKIAPAVASFNAAKQQFRRGNLIPGAFGLALSILLNGRNAIPRFSADAYRIIVDTLSKQEIEGCISTSRAV